MATISDESLAPQVNRTVDRLHGHIPFNADHSEIYEEHQRDVFLHVQTAASDFIETSMKAERRPSLIVLTGDAGHGKTHVIRHMLVDLGVPEAEVTDVLQAQCDGRRLEVGDVVLAVHKDLSEVSPAEAATLLEESARNPWPLIVCVNEGRLRALLSSEVLVGTQLATDVRRALRDSLVEPSEGVLVINLNWQMVSLPDGIMVKLLRKLLDGNRWRTCQRCSSQAHCPIYRNRNVLSERPERVEAIRRLYELVEQLGEVVTIRQVLIHLAYLLTGNLRCERVHRLNPNRHDLAVYAHTSTLFGAGEAPATFIEDHGLFRRLQRLDPAYSASRAVDELLMDADHRRRIVPETSPDARLVYRRHEVDLREQTGPQGMDLDRREHLDDESEILSRAMHILRRHHLLEVAGSDAELSEISGFEHARTFGALLDGSLPAIKRAGVLGQVINGLHRLQFLPPQRSNLYIVDPVSLRARAQTAVVSVRLRKPEVSLEPEEPRVVVGDQRVVDARPRRLVLTARDRSLTLSLWTFEFLCRCAEGLASRDFFSHEVRRLTNFLLLVAEHHSHDDTASANILFNGELTEITVGDGIVEHN